MLCPEVEDRVEKGDEVISSRVNITSETCTTDSGMSAWAVVGTGKLI